jgi:hypothetical protein
MPRPVGSKNKTIHHLICDTCGEPYTAMHPARRHCPRRCSISGCPRLNASGGYCKTHRTQLLEADSKHGPYSAKVARVLVIYRAERGNACDMCGGVFGAVDTIYEPVADHDHAHCHRRFGCLDCIRGLVHSACNLAEGKVRHGMPTVVPANLSSYLVHPPFQQWLRTASLPPLTGRLLVA